MTNIINDFSGVQAMIDATSIHRGSPSIQAFDSYMDMIVFEAIPNMVKSCVEAAKGACQNVGKVAQQFDRAASLSDRVAPPTEMAMSQRKEIELAQTPERNLSPSPEMAASISMATKEINREKNGFPQPAVEVATAEQAAISAKTAYMSQERAAQRNEQAQGLA